MESDRDDEAAPARKSYDGGGARAVREFDSRMVVPRRVSILELSRGVRDLTISSGLRSTPKL
jgi:hypothetical protein